MKKTVLLLSILIIASFFRLYNLEALPPGLYPDEAMNGNNAIEALDHNDWKVFYPENNGREGLFINIQSLSIAAFGLKPWALRLPSAIFGILTVLGLYFLTKELFKNEPLALLTAFLLATSFWHINFSRIGFRAIMAPFFLIWALFFLLKAWHKNENAAQPVQALKSKLWNLGSDIWFWAILAGLSYGLGFYSYIAYRATPVLIILLVFLYYWENASLPNSINTWRIFAIFSVITLLVLLPLGIYFAKNPADFFGRTAQISVFASSTPWKDLGVNVLKTAGMFNFIGDGNWRHNIAGQPQLFGPVGILFLIGLVLSLVKIKTTHIKSWEFSIPLIWLAAAGLPVIVSNEGIPHALRAILMAPAAFILAAIGAFKIYELLKPVFSKYKFWLLVIGSLFLITLVAEAYYSYFIVWGKNPNTAAAFSQDYVNVAKEINALPKELPKYVVVEAGGTIVHGLPMPAQTVMFLTNTFDIGKRVEKNIIYLLPDQAGQINPGQKHYVAFLR